MPGFRIRFPEWLRADFRIIDVPGIRVLPWDLRFTIIFCGYRGKSGMPSAYLPFLPGKFLEGSRIPSDVNILQDIIRILLRTAFPALSPFTGFIRGAFASACPVSSASSMSASGSY